LLDVDDGYRGLAEKTRGICRWANERGYERLCKLDDDVYVQPARLLRANSGWADYIGRLRGPSGSYPAPYCSGFAYWLSSKAIAIVAEAELNGDDAEDRWTANVLAAKGVLGRGDYRFAVIKSGRNTPSASEGPRQGNEIVAACEFTPAQMMKIHEDWLTEPSRAGGSRPLPAGRLSSVCVLIKTFLRDGYLFQCVKGLEEKFPEVKIVIVDDGEDSGQKIRLYSRLRDSGHACVWLPRDSGFGAKANAGVDHCDREFVLVGSDDFDFGGLGVREGVEHLATVLENVPEIGVASGRVNRRAYEATLELGDNWARETAGFYGSNKTGGVVYQLCDLTVNYSLIRRQVFDSVRWDDDVKIGGGEHGAFYIDVKRAGWKTAYVPGVNINEMPHRPAWQHPTYSAMRARARMPGRICLKRRGIDQYHLMGGGVETT
jgi:hypothetical protein